jgi:predicted kinase
MKTTLKINQWLTSLSTLATPNMDECVALLGQDIEWLCRYKDTPQDPEWHAEGNVHIHTNMVLQALYQLLANEAAHITGWKRQALILGAILHDIAKPIRTRRMEIQGIERVVSPQHEATGRSYLAFKLMGFNLSFQVVWTVLNLIGEHHMPKLMMVKNKPANEYWTLARQVNTELLYWLEVADMTGRICPNLDQQLLYLDEFRLFAEEYSSWGQSLEEKIKTTLTPHLQSLPEATKAYVYAHALYEMEQGGITMPEEALATTYQHREEHPHLVIMCGPSGSGKSSWIASHYPDYTLVSLDKLREQMNGKRSIQKNKGRMLQAAKEQLRVALRNKQGVVWDATNLRRDFRDIISDLGRDYHALVSLVVFLLPEAHIFRQNRQRVHAIPDDVLAKQLDGFQFPLLNEAHQILFVGEKGKPLYRSGYYPADEA